MKRLHAVIIILLLLILLATVLFHPRTEASAPSVAVAASSSWLTLSGAVDHGETLSQAMSEAGIADAQVYTLLQSLSKAFDLRKCQVADSFFVEFDSTRTVESFTYSPQKEIKTYHVYRAPNGEYDTEVLAPKLSMHLAASSGTIKNSLYESMAALGLKPKLIMEFANIYQWDIDFLTEPQKGDSFRIVYEEIRAGGRFAGYGDILVAQYKSRTYDKTAYRFDDAEGEDHYFDQNGESFQKAFLKSPLNFTRISSTFGFRRHPITKQVRMHNGIDFAAPRGTPVEAAADGVVSHCGWLGGHPGGNGGYGNTVKIKHSNGYETLYGHMSGFAPGIRVGAHVKQHDVIGYVGSTGMSTGNHLHYTIYQGKAAVDPMQMVNLAANPIPASDRERFGWERLRQQTLLRCCAIKGLPPENEMPL